MPSGDGTGPRGRGPMTGWGRGYCAGLSAPGRMMGAFLDGLSGRRGGGASPSISTYALLVLGSLLLNRWRARTRP